MIDQSPHAHPEVCTPRGHKRLICCLVGWSGGHTSSASTNGDRRDSICTLSDQYVRHSDFLVVLFWVVFMRELICMVKACLLLRWAKIIEHCYS